MTPTNAAATRAAPVCARRAPEYEEMCRQIWEDMQDGKIETGG